LGTFNWGTSVYRGGCVEWMMSCTPRIALLPWLLLLSFCLIYFGEPTSTTPLRRCAHRNCSCLLRESSKPESRVMRFDPNSDRLMSDLRRYPESARFFGLGRPVALGILITACVAPPSTQTCDECPLSLAFRRQFGSMLCRVDKLIPAALADHEDRDSV